MHGLHFAAHGFAATAEHAFAHFPHQRRTGGIHTVLGHFPGIFDVVDAQLRSQGLQFAIGALELFLLEGGFLEGDRLVVDCVVEGGYLVVRVDYLVSFLFFGDVGVVEFYERRLW